MGGHPIHFRYPQFSMVSPPGEFRRCVSPRPQPVDLAEGVSLLTCSAEDLIVFKAFADRAQDWIDIDGIAVRQHRRLDEGLIWQELTPLLELKEDDQAGPRLRRLLEHR